MRSSKPLHSDGPGSGFSAEQAERFVEAIAASQQALTGYIRTLVLDADDADDILQETNVVLWRKAAEYDPSTKFTTWACRVAHYQVLAHRRDRGRDRHQFLSTELIDDLADRSTAQAEQIESRVKALRACLEKLTDRQRLLIAQRYDTGGSVQTLAEQRGQSAGALSVTLTRIRRKLHDCIRDSIKAQGS